MLQVRLHALTPKRFEQFRADLDRAIETSFVAALMTRKWNGRTLQTAAPATYGVIRYEASGVYAEFRVSWPGIPMKDVIIQTSHQILAAATGSPVTVWLDSAPGVVGGGRFASGNGRVYNSSTCGVKERP